MKPHRLLIVGAGAMGRQFLSKAMEVPEAERDWEIGGFLDDRPGILDGYNRPYGILGAPLSFEFSDSDRVVCAIAHPRTRLDYCEKLALRGARFTSFVHPSATIDPTSRIGEGCLIGPMSVIDCDATVGDHVIIHSWGGVGHDVRVGNGCSLSSHMVIAGGCTLGRGVFIGINATVNENTEIGDFAALASGSVASGRIPARAVMMGVPARPIRQWARFLRDLESGVRPGKV